MILRGCGHISMMLLNITVKVLQKLWIQHYISYKNAVHCDTKKRVIVTIPVVGYPFRTYERHAVVL